MTMKTMTKTKNFAEPSKLRKVLFTKCFTIMKRDLMQEERQKIAKLEVANYFVNFEDGSSLLFYVDTNFHIGANTIKKYCEKVTGDEVLEVYHVPQKDLQYFCIDQRVWINKPEMAEKLKEIANS